MDPQQLLVPKLSVSINSEGTLVSPPLEDLSPLVSIDILEKYMRIPLHPNSHSLQRNKNEAKGDAIY